MKLSNDWFTALSTADNGNLVIVTGRKALQEFKATKKLSERIEVTWKYEGDSQGMPTDSEAELMEEVQDLLQKTMEKDKLAIMSSVYTGDYSRIIVFYARTSRVFGERINEALSTYEQLPLSIYVELDEEWEEYSDMLEMQAWAVE
ncbi:MAG: DUF695 domain-containing protein [Bacteroidales bacterium]